MVCVDQDSGLRSGPEPLATMATYRRREGGKITFGALMSISAGGQGGGGPFVLEAGAPLRVVREGGGRC